MKLFLLFNFYLLNEQINAQETVQTKKLFAKQLSFRAAIVIPVYNNYNMYSIGIDGFDVRYNINATYKLYSAFGLQYKNKHNALFELQFQHYTFNFKGPVYYENNGLKFYNQMIPYYDVYEYGQFRISFGMGQQFNLSKKSSLGIILGTTALLGDQGSFYVYHYSLDGTLLGGGAGFSGEGGLAPYTDLSYSYNIITDLWLIASLNYFFLYYKGGGYFNDPYYVNWQNLLSLNIGFKYNIINKAPKQQAP